MPHKQKKNLFFLVFFEGGLAPTLAHPLWRLCNIVISLYVPWYEMVRRFPVIASNSIDSDHGHSCQAKEQHHYIYIHPCIYDVHLD